MKKLSISQKEKLQLLRIKYPHRKTQVLSVRRNGVARVKSGTILYLMDKDGYFNQIKGEK